MNRYQKLAWFNLAVIAATTAIASTAFWWVFILSCFLLWLIVGPEKSIPSIALPLMAFGAALFIKTVCSVAILVQYGREQADG